MQWHAGTALTATHIEHTASHHVLMQVPCTHTALQVVGHWRDAASPCVDEYMVARTQSHLTPAVSKTGPRRLSRMNSPEVAVASATRAQRSDSMGAMHAKLIGMNIASAYPANRYSRVSSCPGPASAWPLQQ